MLSPLKRFIGWIDRQEWLDKASVPLQKAIREVYRAGGSAGNQTADFIHGVWLGHPLHASLTDMVVGPWTATLVLDTAAMVSGSKKLLRAAQITTALGLVGALGAIVAGATDWQHTRGHQRRVGLAHAALNLTGGTLYAASWLLRKNKLHTLGQIAAMLGYGDMVVAAYLGGHLAYADKMGVNYAPVPQGPAEFTAVLPEEQLGEGELRKVLVNDIPVLLVRHNGQLYAMVEVCSHLGGPLSRGRIEDDSVRCPWHGSHYALDDGDVVGGPSTHPQTCFEARVRNGQIEIQLPPDEVLHGYGS